eukprot:2732872-Pleurochrysis_carterae.AAC.2
MHAFFWCSHTEFPQGRRSAWLTPSEFWIASVKACFSLFGIVKIGERVLTRYATVPTKVDVSSVFGSSCLEMPKSATATTPSLSRSTLAGLRSRWLRDCAQKCRARSEVVEQEVELSNWEGNRNEGGENGGKPTVI